MSLNNIFSICLALMLVSCGTLPASGPYSVDMLKDTTVQITGRPDTAQIVMQPEIDYALIEINEHTINAITKYRKPQSKSQNWPENTSPHITKIEIGDVIRLTIYEQNSGGLFVPKEAGVRPGNFITLPSQTVDSSGYITIPYAGQVMAAGKTANEISVAVTIALSDLALAPQVVVSFESRGGTEVSVFGDVGNASRFSLGFNRERVLDIIAAAGGPRSPGYETWVSLQRDDTEHSILMDELLLNPKKNIYVQPDDTLYLYRESETFNIYGAAEFQGTLPFNKRKLNLAEALGRAQGLNDFQADPAEIYIYKEEPIAYIRSIENHMSLKYSDLETPFVPVIYKLNLRKHGGFFFAQKFPVYDQDTVYIANAESVEYLKFLNIVNSTSTTKRSVRSSF